MNRDINELEKDYPPTNLDDSYLDIIAETEPKELDIALRQAIFAFESADNFNRESKQKVDDTWLKISEYGEETRGIYSGHAQELQKILAKYNEAGLTPPADLLDSVYSAVESAETPSEILGLRSIPGIFLQAESQMSDDAQELVDGRKSAYEIAKPVKARRNKLGRPARIATWLAGIVMISGVGAGVAKADLDVNQNQSNHKEVAEVVFKSSVIGMLSLMGLQGTVYSAHHANNGYANRRAKKILKKFNS